MAYLENTSDQQQEMLQVIGVRSMSDLFEQIPVALRLDRPLALPPALTELELETHVRRLAARNASPENRITFMGGGSYDHFIPSAVDAVAGRSEFYTAYTPYQAEASQGSLQAFFEFQTLICQLTGMDVSNASLYEGGTAVSEAVFMAMRSTDRHKKVVVLGSVHPEYREVVRTYLHQLNCELVTIPTPEGVADPKLVAGAIDSQTACLVIQHPNFFGGLEDTRQLVEIAHKQGALAIVSFDPISLGLLARPGDYGADIAVAEGQSLGTPMQFGGPYLGILACKEQFVRKMPGRLVGETKDRLGRRCYVLTMQAREQHIRREKATSNICTNQGLMAIRATVFLSLLGKAGLREVAELCVQKAHYAAEQLAAAGAPRLFPGPFFKEFAVKPACGAEEFLRRAGLAGIDVGPPLASFKGELAAQGGVLIAVTEKRSRDDIDLLAKAVSG